ncbi:MAG: hypothetical protein Q8S54_08980 [Bacteroidota bacterium]|nr:hypothetical protein [Bacteroidota bacterium]
MPLGTQLYKPCTLQNIELKIKMIGIGAHPGIFIWKYGFAYTMFISSPLYSFILDV